MPVLDNCVTSNFEPGNIGASSGTEPIIIRPGTIYDPETYDPDAVSYSLHFQRFYNFAYYGAL